MSTSDGPADPHAEILERVHAGDGEAFFELCQEIMQPLRVFVRLGAGRARSPSQSIDDFVQETLIAAWNSRSRFDAHGEGTIVRQFQRWVMTISKRILAGAAEQNLRTQPGTDTDPHSLANKLAARGRSIISELGALDDSERLAQAISRLTDSQQRCVIHRYLMDWTLKDVANETGYPESTVRSELRAALSRLRDLL